MKKKYIAYIIAIAAIAAGFLVIGTSRRFVLADTENPGKKTYSIKQNSAEDNNQNEVENEGDNKQESLVSGTRSKLSINQSGSVQITGAKLTSISGLNLSVTVFGLPISVTTAASSTRFIGVTDASHLAVGDTLSVGGTIDQTSGVVTASTIQDESQRQQTIDSLKQQIQALFDQLNKLLQAQGGGR